MSRIQFISFPEGERDKQFNIALEEADLDKLGALAPFQRKEVIQGLISAMVDEKSDIHDLLMTHISTLAQETITSKSPDMLHLIEYAVDFQQHDIVEALHHTVTDQNHVCRLMLRAVAPGNLKAWTIFRDKYNRDHHWIDYCMEASGQSGHSHLIAPILAANPSPNSIDESLYHAINGEHMDFVQAIFPHTSHNASTALFMAVDANFYDGVTYFLSLVDNSHTATEAFFMTADEDMALLLLPHLVDEAVAFFQPEADMEPFHHALLQARRDKQALEAETMPTRDHKSRSKI